MAPTNILKGQPPLAPSARIQIFFDRLLLPSSVTRQTVRLTDDKLDNINPEVDYDPVARAVVLKPPGPLDPNIFYRVVLAQPNDSGTGWLEAIDGATLAPAQIRILEFPVAQPDADSETRTPPFQPVDFCSQVMPIFQSKCDGANCHGGSSPAAGLRLDSAASIAATAIGRVAQGANTGPRAVAQPGGALFGQDMPIVDPTAPGDSWLMYKLLMAAPPPCSSTADAPPCDAGKVAVHQNFYVAEPWNPMSAQERTTLASLVLGREMPFPSSPGAKPGTSPDPLTVDELELVSFWIQQGASVPSCPP